MTTTDRLDAARAALQRIHALCAQGRDRTDSGPDHTHNPDHDADRAAYADAEEAERILAKIAEDAARVAGGEYRPTYNGWPNRETWNAALWMDNEQPLYDDARQLVRQAFTDYVEPELLRPIRAQEPPEQAAAGRRRAAINDAGELLSEWYAETIGAPDSGALADVVGYALACVDWPHIAENIADELELGDPAAIYDEDDDPDEDDGPAGPWPEDENENTGAEA